MPQALRHLEGGSIPYIFEFDWEHRIVRARLSGRVTDNDLRDMYREGFKVNFQTEPTAGLLDVSEITSIEVSASTVRDLAKATPIALKESLPRVVIAPSAETYILARLFEALGKATRPNLHVVRTEAEAFGIIGVKKPKFDPLDRL